MRECTKYCIEVKYKVLIDVRVFIIIEGELDVDLVATHEAIRRHAHHCLLVHVESWHSLIHGLSPAICAIFEGEATFDYARVSDVRETVAVEHDLGTTLVDARSRTQAVDLGRIVIAEEEARINPVNAIERDLHGQGLR